MHTSPNAPRSLPIKLGKNNKNKRGQIYLSPQHILDDLKQPPGNHLEALKGNRKGQHSIRVNDQWRICFKWLDGDVYDVEIVDYH